MKKMQEVYFLEEKVNIDGKESTMTAKITFNTEKGTIKIVPQMTTKQLSFNEMQQGEALGCMKRLIDRAYSKGLELSKDWIEKNRPGIDPSQMNLFDAANGNVPELEPELEEPTPVGQKKPSTKKRVKKKNKAEVETAA